MSTVQVHAGAATLAIMVIRMLFMQALYYSLTTDNKFTPSLDRSDKLFTK